MTEVAAGTPNTGVAPLAVLGGHPDDEPADRVHDPWAARSATAAAVVCPRDQLSMPAEEGIGRDQGVQVTAYPSPEARGLCGQAPALGVGEPETARTELLAEDAILFLEIVNDVTLLLVDPARDGHDEELQHLGNRRHTGRAEQRLSAVTNVATRRASSVESARRTASIGFLDSTRLTKELGIAAVPHGFRSSFRDWAAERTNTPREVVEATLAHTVQNPTEAAYARSDLFELRRRLMDEWAAYLCAGGRGLEGGRSLSAPDPNVHEAGLVTRDLLLV